MKTQNAKHEPTQKHGTPYYEPEDGGSWWIDLADGWTVDGCSAVHEKTKKAAIARLTEAVKSH